MEHFHINSRYLLIRAKKFDDSLFLMHHSYNRRGRLFAKTVERILKLDVPLSLQ